MAVGVSCAGTGMRAALDLLAPLLTDAVDFVRQGALIANALVLMQQPESKACRLLYPHHSGPCCVSAHPALEAFVAGRAALLMQLETDSHRGRAC